MIRLTKINFMGTFLYTLATAMTIIWTISFIGYGNGGLTHILLVYAAFIVLVRLIQARVQLSWK